MPLNGKRGALAESTGVWFCDDVLLYLDLSMFPFWPTYVIHIIPKCFQALWLQKWRVTSIDAQPTGWLTVGAASSSLLKDMSVFQFPTVRHQENDVIDDATADELAHRSSKLAVGGDNGK